jgi:transposase InsO family protein
VYPCLLRNRTIEQPNQAWAMDVTYIPMARGFVFLTAIIVWATRRILAHRPQRLLPQGRRVSVIPPQNRRVQR